MKSPQIQAIEKLELLGYSKTAIEFLMGAGGLYGLSSWLDVAEILAADNEKLASMCESLISLQYDA